MMPPHDESTSAPAQSSTLLAAGSMMSNSILASARHQEDSLSSPPPSNYSSVTASATTATPPPPPPFNMMNMYTNNPTAAAAVANNNTGNSEYHPDFMFCGSCTTCQPVEEKKSTTSVEETLDGHYLPNNNHHKNVRRMDSEEDDEEAARHVTKLIITSVPPSASTSSQVLLIQSLLQPLTGVESVVVDKKQMKAMASSSMQVVISGVRVRHTLQTSQAQLVAALKRGGFTGQLVVVDSTDEHAYAAAAAVSLTVEDGLVEQHDSTTTSQIVRSQFHVGGICCAMEIPAIRKIVRPLFGVETVQINITTKMVYVQHDAKSIAAEAIAESLTREGFPSDIKVDGGRQQQQQQQKQLARDGNSRQNRVGRTTLHVQGRVLHDQDVVVIQQQLSNVPGIERVTVIVRENVISVQHDTDLVDSHTIPSLAGNDYCLEVVQTAQEEWQTQSLFQSASSNNNITKSKYVESTIVVAHLQHRNVPTIQTIFKQNYIRAQARACFAHVPSQTIKVEHNPDLLSVHDIPRLLEPYGLNAHVAIDGKEAGLVLPMTEDYGPQHQHNVGGNSGDEKMMMEDDSDPSASLPAHVILSGLFWVLSMLSVIGGTFVYFEYFGLLSVFFGLPPVARKAWRTIRRRQFDSNCMMVTAALGALALQEFDEAASVAFLFSVSEYLEARSTSKARKALKAIVQLRPEHASVINPTTKEIVIVPASQVPVGSLLSVRMGDKIATDGVVVEGVSTVDESSLTGESKPIMKRVDDTVSGGTINVGTTQLIVKTTTSIEDSVVSRLIKVVEDAQSSRSLTEKLIDRFAKAYTPFVVCMAAIMCTVPWIFGAEIGRYWTLNGLIIIVIACPCSLTISTPVTYAAALAATAQRGIIVKGGAHLEALGGVETVVVDKTGTITKGQFRVDNLQVTGTARTRNEMLELLALMEAPSSHPLSATLVRAAQKEGVSIPRDAEVSLHTVLKGEGVTAKVNGKQVYVGNKRLFGRIGLYANLPLEYQDIASEWARDGATVGFIGIENVGIIGAFSMVDTIREEARDTIEALYMMNIDVVMLTGDGSGAAHAVARQVGIPPSAVHSQLLPEDKLHYVGSLIRPEPSRCGPCRARSKVLFIGDGINDTPALAVADVGVSMGDGAAALAMEISDVTLMDSNLSKLLYVIKMGRRVVNTITENIAISLTSKIIVVALTFAGKMTLFGAIASDVGVMLLVTLNGMKLLPLSSELELEPKARRRMRSPKSKPEYDEILKNDMDTSDYENNVELSDVYLSDEDGDTRERDEDELPERLIIV